MKIIQTLLKYDTLTILYGSYLIKDHYLFAQFRVTVSVRKSMYILDLRQSTGYPL